MANFLDRDLGSDSEDDNFNPAPADESDNEAQEDSDGDGPGLADTDGSRRRPASPTSQFRRAVDHEDDIASTAAPLAGDATSQENGEKVEDEEDADGVGEDLGDGEDDEDEDEDDDDEEAITVRHTSAVKGQEEL